MVSCQASSVLFCSSEVLRAVQWSPVSQYTCPSTRVLIHVFCFLVLKWWLQVAPCQSLRPATSSTSCSTATPATAPWPSTRSRRPTCPRPGRWSGRSSCSGDTRRVATASGPPPRGGPASSESGHVCLSAVTRHVSPRGVVCDIGCDKYL